MANTHEHWNSVIDQHFSESGVFMLRVCSDKPEGGSKEFTIAHATLPRFFVVLFNTQVESLQISINGAITENTGTETRVTCERARFTYVYKPETARGCPIEVSLPTYPYLLATK
jgi:hypothetical protein